MKQALLYGFRVWLTTVIASPLLALAYHVGHTNQVDQETAGLLWMTMIPTAHLYSIPALILLAVVVLILSKLTVRVVTIKLILSILSSSTIVLVLRVIFPDEGWVLPIIYPSIVIGSIWLYELKPYNTAFTSLLSV